MALPLRPTERCHPHDMALEEFFPQKIKLKAEVMSSKIMLPLWNGQMEESGINRVAFKKSECTVNAVRWAAR